jgi:hypothetical protein
MKSIRFLIGIVLLFALVGYSVQSASAATWSYTSGFQVQNLDTTNPASITIDFFDGSGNSPAGSQVQTQISAGGSVTEFPLNTVQSGFNGSVVISSNAPLASVVNIIATSGSSKANAAYIGASSGSTTVTLPLLMANNSGYNTWFTVQNTGTTATKISAAYSDGKTADSGSTLVAPNASYTFRQANETGHSKVFSGTVTSTPAMPLVATVVEEGTSIIFAYNGFAAGSNNPVMPLINANNGGVVTGTQIMNTGSLATDVTLSYSPSGAGAACTETQTIPGGQSRTFTFFALAAGSPQPPEGGMVTTCVGGAKFIGSAQVTGNSASQKLVAIVNQLKPNVNGEAYSAFDPTLAGSSVTMPLIMDRNSGWFTGFSVMNVGTTTATVNCTFSKNANGGAAPSYALTNVSLGANQALVDIQSGKIMNKYAGSGTCTATGGKLVGIVNELSNAPGANLLVYEGISQ